MSLNVNRSSFIPPTYRYFSTQFPSKRTHLSHLARVQKFRRGTNNPFANSYFHLLSDSYNTLASYVTQQCQSYNEAWLLRDVTAVLRLGVST